jgi:hypothetical protein
MNFGGDSILVLLITLWFQWNQHGDRIKLRDENKITHKLVHDFEILYLGCVVSEEYATFNSEAFIKMEAVRNILLSIEYVTNYNNYTR